MSEIEKLILENQMVIMSSLKEINELSNAQKSYLDVQIKKVFEKLIKK